MKNEKHNELLLIRHSRAQVFGFARGWTRATMLLRAARLPQSIATINGAPVVELERYCRVDVWGRRGVGAKGTRRAVDDGVSLAQQIINDT